MVPRRRLLVADDNRELALVLKLVLEDQGYEVRLAHDGWQALLQQRLVPSEVLIVDLIMPARDGFETIDIFRREFPGTRIVVISGGGRLHAALHLSSARLIGADATLEKPFGIKALLKILTALERRPAG
jgi:DNA-binding response OmpR family regulator